MKWFLGVLFFLLAALILESGLLAYAMYVLLGVLILSRFLARTWINALSAVRTPSRLNAEIGEILNIKIKVQNKGWLPVPWVLLEDLLPRKALSPGQRRLRVKGKRLQIAMVPPRGDIKLRYQLKVQSRGYYQIGPLIMETGDLFGLHRRYRVGTEPDYLLVYPRIIPFEGYDIASRRPIGEVRLTHRLYEDPTRISGIREYQPGDPMNRVHWRATARTGKLHCKVYEPSTIAGATILLDFHESAFPKRGEPHRSELAVTTVMSLTHAVYQLGQQVGLITNGRDAADRIRVQGWQHEDFRTRKTARREAVMAEDSDRLRPLVVETRRGVEHFQQIREVLARVELTDGLSFGQLVVETGGRLPRDATVIAIVADAPTETALALGNLRRQGFAVMAILILLEENQLADAHARLLAQGILDVRHLKDEAGISSLCQREVLGTTAYAFTVPV